MTETIKPTYPHSRDDFLNAELELQGYDRSDDFKEWFPKRDEINKVVEEKYESHLVRYFRSGKDYSSLTDEVIEATVRVSLECPEMEWCGYGERYEIEDPYKTIRDHLTFLIQLDQAKSRKVESCQ